MKTRTSTRLLPLIHPFAKRWLTLVAGILTCIAALLCVQTSAAGPVMQADVEPGVPDVSPGSIAVGIDGPSSILFTYQGQLLDTVGNPINSPGLAMTFKIYSVATGGTACWTEDHGGSNSIPVQNGIFQVRLGEFSAVPATCLATDAYLEIVIASQTLAPRELLTSVAFAVEARTVPDASITGAKIGNDAIGSSKIQDGQVTSADITNDTVSETDIVDTFKARDADKLDNLDSSAFSLSTHDHDARYFTESESDTRFVNATGDTMAGNLTVNGRLYSTGELWSDSNLSAFGTGSFGQTGVGEGGEVVLRSGSSGNAWSIDNYLGRFRVFHDGTVYMSMESNGDTNVNGKLTITGPDLIMNYAPRGDAGRALVHMNGDTLVVNYDGDFTGGVRVDSNLDMNGHSLNNCGALVEANLQTKEELAAGRIERFDEGEVLCWAVAQLELCSSANDRLVQAVADAFGRPIVIGAEKIRVLGSVQHGDILVASSTPGYAMVNNNPQPGSVIAQALEEFHGQRGLIKAMIRKW